ncbi:hypothetical protein IMZ48_19820 [Candidatus Bathyarchaeota archaeon]|nr:hypothetical protein [Candidatus Bathyarchaeota archaeon]
MQGLPFEKVKHQVSTLDAQAGPYADKDGGVLILVTGQLLVCFAPPVLDALDFLPSRTYCFRYLFPRLP